MIFETHAHYDDDAFKEDREDILRKLEKDGIGYVINASSSMKSTLETICLTERFAFIYGACGVHPEAVAELDEEKFIKLKEIIYKHCYIKATKSSSLQKNNRVNEMCPTKKIVAVGEIGLDYYWPQPSHEDQKYWFMRQLELAIMFDLPVIIHSREAALDTLAMVKDAYFIAKEQNKTLTGVIHCFSYGMEMAREYLAMGFYLGITGVVTFKNAKKIIEVVKEVPIMQLVVETDCPYLAPEPHRGKRNTSNNLAYIIKKIADIKGMEEKEIEEITYQNGLKLYGLA